MTLHGDLDVLRYFIDGKGNLAAVDLHDSFAVDASGRAQRLTMAPTRCRKAG